MNRTEKSIQNFKAIELIKTFSSLEMKRFGRFLQSPYHNNNQDLILLFDFLRPLYPTFNQAKLNRPKIWKALFKTKPFQAIKFKKMFSELNLLAEEFISIESLKSNKQAQQKQLIAALKPRHFKRFVKASQFLIQEIEERDAYKIQQDFLDLHLLYHDLWYHVEWERHQVNQKELLTSHLALVSYLAFNEVRTVSEIKNRSKFLNISNQSLIETIKFEKDIGLFQQNLPYALFFSLFEFVQQPSFPSYLEIKKGITTHSNFLSKTYLQDAVTHLNNFLSKEIAKGKEQLRAELFNLLKWATELKIFVVNDTIQEVLFSNTVIIAISTNHLDWARKYLQINSRFLKSSQKDLILGYLEASLSFVENKFENTLYILSKLQPTHKIQYYFYFKTLISKSLFELVLLEKHHYQESLYFELMAFEKGVQRNKKFTPTRKVNFLNYIKVLRRLSKINSLNENKKIELTRLKDEIKSMDSLSQRNWLQEKIDLILKRRYNRF